MSFHRARAVAIASLVSCFLVGQASESGAQGLSQGVFLSAEQAAQKVIGKKVWIVTADGAETEGTVIASTAGQLALATPHNGAQQIFLGNIRRIDTRKSSGRGILWGLSIGAASGVTFGTVLAVSSSNGTRGAGTVWATGIALASAGGLLGYMFTSGRTTVYAANPSIGIAVVPQLAPGVVGARIHVRW